MILWRISEHASLDGAGGLIVAGRWHSKGRRITYLAESSALAMLEVLVHLETATVPPPFQLLRISGPDWPDFQVPPPELAYADERATRAWGDAWLAGGQTVLAKVPSRVAPMENNWLLNPAHHSAELFGIDAASRQPWDPRLFGA
jgi:RES domain-containing protein